jgi:hypothetical protein
MLSMAKHGQGTRGGPCGFGLRVVLGRCHPIEIGWSRRSLPALRPDRAPELAVSSRLSIKHHPDPSEIIRISCIRPGQQGRGRASHSGSSGRVRVGADQLGTTPAQSQHSAPGGWPHGALPQARPR